MRTPLLSAPAPASRHFQRYVILLLLAAIQAALAKPVQASFWDFISGDTETQAIEELTNMSQRHAYSFISYVARENEPITSFTVSCEDLDGDRIREDNWARTFSLLNGTPPDYTASQVIFSCEGVLGAASNGITLGAPGMPYIVEEDLDYFDMLIVDTTIHVVREGEGGNL